MLRWVPSGEVGCPLPLVLWGSCPFAVRALSWPSLFPVMSTPCHTISMCCLRISVLLGVCGQPVSSRLCSVSGRHCCGLAQICFLTKTHTESLKIAYRTQQDMYVYMSAFFSSMCFLTDAVVGDSLCFFRPFSALF